MEEVLVIKLGLTKQRVIQYQPWWNGDQNVKSTIFYLWWKNMKCLNSWSNKILNINLLGGNDKFATEWGSSIGFYHFFSGLFDNMREMICQDYSWANHFLLPFVPNFCIFALKALLVVLKW